MFSKLFNPTRSLPFAHEEPDPSLASEYVPLRTSDGADVFGVLYQPRGHRIRTCFLAVHPRGDYSRFYAAPGLARLGYGVLCLTTRYLNNDTDAQHERMLLDLAAAMRHLRDRGVEQVVLLGNSGGGSLTSFYQRQAALPADGRIERTPGGDRVPLASEDMPLAVAQVHVAVHNGEGDFMRRAIDPAVVDESDPLATEPTLDMYDPANGHRPFPEPSTYDSGWLERYRSAQVERCRRLDAIARGLIERRRGLRNLVKAEPDGAPAHVRRASVLGRYMVVYRTLANPFYLDPSIDPSERSIGSSFTLGIDPMIGNYGPNGLGRIVTPRGWLSTWSPHHTQTRMTDNLPGYDIPSLFVEASGDTEIPPSEFAEIVAACPATDRTYRSLRADHYLRPLAEGDPDPRAELDEILGSWTGERFPE